MDFTRQLKSLLYICAGIALIVIFAGGLIIKLALALMGLMLINEGLKARGFYAQQRFMQFWMMRGGGRF